MWNFFTEGGPGMWAILVFGLVFVGAALHYAWKGAALADAVDVSRRRFLSVLGVLLAVASVNSMLIDAGKVFSYVARIQGASRVELVLQGMSESTRPGIFGGAILVLGLALFAVGCHRRARRAARG